ncbi:hypothetical protein B2K_11780 [Paenibacillus mucilaginosus K02]|uniref:Uncharacterized protein n=2 Tax=Paenibacillus mucilaginosus TaxID=61624 RepID=I0BG95_9BACL|nr:hypothetical protein B2K_11780 [Paenibacillus mucilaginosus K02]
MDEIDEDVKNGFAGNKAGLITIIVILGILSSFLVFPIVIYFASPFLIKMDRGNVTLPHGWFVTQTADGGPGPYNIERSGKEIISPTITEIAWYENFVIFKRVQPDGFESVGVIDTSLKRKNVHILKDTKVNQEFLYNQYKIPKGIELNPVEEVWFKLKR